MGLDCYISYHHREYGRCLFKGFLSSSREVVVCSAETQNAFPNLTAACRLTCQFEYVLHSTKNKIIPSHGMILFFDHLHENFVRDSDLTVFFHFLLTLLLLVAKFHLSSNITAVEVTCHIFLHG